MRKIYPVIIIVWISSCAVTSERSYFYNEIRVVNNSSQLIRNVTIRVPSKGREFSCGNIAPLGLCSNRFGKRSYERNPIQISWTFGNRSRQTDEFIVEVPATLYAGIALIGVLEITPGGAVRAYFDQNTPQN